MLPFNPNPNLQASVGSQWLPLKHSRKYPKAPLQRCQKVQEQEEFTKPLPEPALSVVKWGLLTPTT